MPGVSWVGWLVFSLVAVVFYVLFMSWRHW